MSKHSIRSLGILALTIGFLVGCGERQKGAESDSDIGSAVAPVVVTQAASSMKSADKAGSGTKAGPHPTSPSKDLFLSFCGYLNGSQDSTAQIDLATVTEENTAEMMKIKGHLGRICG